MTALAKNINVEQKGPAPDLRRYLVADNVHIYKGGVIVRDSSGYARPARNTAGEFVLGMAYEEFDNTLLGHAAGGTVNGKTGVRVVSNQHFLLLCSATATQASVGTPFYALDDQTIRATAAVGNLVGVVTEYIDATHVWVFIPSPIALVDAGGASLAGVGAGYKVARGVASITGSGDVVTGLATVVAVVATPADDPDGVALAMVSATIGNQSGAPAAGSVTLKAWKVTATGNATLIAATAAKNINWIAIGT